MPEQIELLVPNYNTADLIIAGIIEPLKEHWGRALLLTIHDDGSSPDDISQLAPALPPSANLTQSVERAGPAVAFNALLNAARGSLSFLCNSDVVIPNIEQLHIMARAHGHAGNRSIIGTAEGPRFLDKSARPYSLKPTPDLKNLCPQDYVSACAMMFRADLLPTAERFNPAFTDGYYEDTDLCYRLRSRGWTTYYTTTKIAHIGNQAMLRRQLEATTEKERFDFLANIAHNMELFRPKWSPYLNPKTDIISEAVELVRETDTRLIEGRKQCLKTSSPTPP